MLKAKITFGQTALEKSPEGAAYGLALSPPQPCPKHSWQRPGINVCSDLAWYIGPGSVQEQLLSEAREGRAHGGREPERQWGQRSISAVPGPARSRLAQSLAATPSPFCPRTQAGRDGSGRQSPIPRPSGVRKVRVYLHEESGPRVPTLMGRRSNQPSSCSCDKSCTGRWSAHPPVLGDAKEGPVLLPWDTYKTSA